MKVQEQDYNFPEYEGKSGDTKYASSTIGDNNNIIGYKDFISNFVNKETPLEATEISASTAMTIAKSSSVPIGAQKFSNIEQFTIDYWDTWIPGTKTNFKTLLKKNNIEFETMDQFLNSFKINKTKLSTGAKNALESKPAKSSSKK